MGWGWWIAHIGMFVCQIVYAFIIAVHFEDLFPKKKQRSAFFFMFFFIIFLGMLFIK